MLPNGCETIAPALLITLAFPPRRFIAIGSNSTSRASMQASTTIRRSDETSRVNGSYPRRWTKSALYVRMSERIDMVSDLFCRRRGISDDEAAAVVHHVHAARSRREAKVPEHGALHHREFFHRT